MPFGVGLLAGPNTGLAGAPDQGLGIKFAVQTEIGNIFASLPVAVVSTRESWEDEWTERPELYCSTCRKTTGDQVGQATLLYEYGRMMRDGDTDFAQEDPLEINGHWVKIEFETQTGDDDVVWLGVILQDSRDRFGAAVGKHNGNQVFSCASVEWFLSKVQVDSSTVGDGADWFDIDRGLAFNEGFETFGKSSKNVGNMSEDPHTDGYYTFTKSAKGEKWPASEMVYYLLRRTTIFSAAGPTIEVDEDSLETLAWYFPKHVETHGRTIFEIVNQIVSERYGVAWSLDYDGTNVTFRAYSYAREDIDLPSSRIFPKNSHPLDIDFDEATDIQKAMEIRDVAQRYSQIKVQGARRGSVCTLSLDDGSLVKDWTDAEEEEYKIAASETTGFADMNFDKQITANDRFRVEHRMRKVFTAFKIPDDWDGMVSPLAGNGGFATLPVFPALDSSGDPTFVSEKFLLSSLRIQDQTVLLEYADYSTNPISTALTGGRQESDFLQSFAMWLMDGEDGADKWMAVDRLSDFGKANDVKRVGTDVFGRKRNGFQFDCSLQLSRKIPGLSITPNGPAHFQAGETWYEDAPALSWTEPEIDYREFAVTVFIESDSYVEAYWPAIPLDPMADQESVLLIQLGDAYRLDFLVQGTILAVNKDGDAKRSITSTFVNDDRQALKDAARLLGLWHTIPRVSFRLAYNQISSLFSVGWLVQQVGSGDTLTEVNSIITAIDWDFQTGQTTITTSFTEMLDVTELL